MHTFFMNNLIPYTINKKVCILLVLLSDNDNDIYITMHGSENVKHVSFL